MPQAAVWKRIEISAAHHIPNHKGKCAREHGHNYVVEIGVVGPVNPETGMVKDFYDIKTDIDLVIVQPCDHRDLNQVYKGMLTTAENLAVTWLQQLRKLDDRYTVVRVFETSTSFVEVWEYQLRYE